jgi:hypothetical protein
VLVSKHEQQAYVVGEGHEAATYVHLAVKPAAHAAATAAATAAAAPTYEECLGVCWLAAQALQPHKSAQALVF